ncbi:MAG: DUF4912 domain-containing protein [Treponema sp.]|nr:DUF4912 domain-containing protein [Treponema sp.]
MDSYPLTRPYLESLTSAELVKWADQYGVDIPPDLDRIFIIEELLSIVSSEVETEEETVEEPPKKFPVSVVLPKQYNITFLEVLIRDPLWAFAFWEVKSSDKEIFEKALDFNGYFLKVCPWGPHEAFTVPLMPEDSALYLGFPPAGENENGQDRQFKIELYAERGGEEIMLAATDPFRLPCLCPRIDKLEDHWYKKYPLIQLSGIDDFHIIRNGDRQLRSKRHGDSAAF